ncbi:hypothetical protein [Sporosarcina jiandibaonis]|uniref:hypothetical protein n=1 Tax=Sporosarcina jiandibaonis TaxID=2715535 RepID=UPI0015580D07|nr:hypothetical protein [Sporosarcina jiandibaonis]
MTTLTEQQLEDQLIEQLVQNGYEPAIIPNVDSLQANFRKQMNRLNRENLAGTKLADKEFTRFLLMIEGESVFESAKILRDKQVLQRDDDS